MPESLIIKKEKFLKYIYAANAIAAAFQTRNKNAHVYEVNIDENIKTPFKEMLLNHIMNLWKDKKEITKHDMLYEIIALKAQCEKEPYKFILKDGIFRIGISQKLICLYAKFLWVSGHLTSPPPLIPYDNVVKKLLNDDTLTDWTVLDCEAEYERITNRIEEVSKNNPAEWELINWNESLLNKIQQ